jgi:hypothetical protein
MGFWLAGSGLMRPCRAQVFMSEPLEFPRLINRLPKMFVTPAAAEARVCSMTPSKLKKENT